MEEKVRAPKTWLLVRPNFMAEYVLGAFAGNPDYEVVWHEATHGFLNVLKRFLRVKLFRRRRGLWVDSFYSRAYLEKLRAIRPGDRVVIWALGNMKDISLLSAEIDCHNIVSYLWDPMRKISHKSLRKSRLYARRMARLGVKVFTFDREDARNFNLNYAGQVYRRPDSAGAPEIRNDIFFIGVDKGRAPMLEALAEECRREGIRFKCMVQPDKHGNLDGYPLLREQQIEAPVAYPEVMREIAASKSLLEIMQTSQSGLTLRTLEAMFFGKKLITDNKAVKEEPLYDPASIYIIGDVEQPWKSVREFLDTPVDMSARRDVLERYEIRTWIHSLFR